MIDELTIYNLSVKYPNTIDLVREVERIAREDAVNDVINKIRQHTDYFLSKGVSDLFIRFEIEELKEKK